MADELVAVSVLNGEVQAGDTIAYATRTGSWMDMNIATVLGIGERNVCGWGDRVEAVVPVLKVEVAKSSRYPVDMDPYKATVGRLNRVVKLNG
jgi:hypothetical protein